MECPRCASDLHALARLNQLPDVLFNQALKAAQSGDWLTATQRLGALLSLRYKDGEAWWLLGLVYARRGSCELARDCWNMALLLRPGDPRAGSALAALRQLGEPPAAPAAEGSA